MASLPERNTRFPVSDAMGISELPRRRGNNSSDVHAILCNLGLVPIGFVSVFMFLDMFYDVYLNLLVRGSQHVGFSSNVGDRRCQVRTSATSSTVIAGFFFVLFCFHRANTTILFTVVSTPSMFLLNRHSPSFDSDCQFELPTASLSTL